MSKVPPQYSWDPCVFLTRKSIPGSKYALVVLNREIKDFCCGPEFIVNLWQNATVRITVDGGTDEWLAWLKYHKLMNRKMNPPEMITGDFDSISQNAMQYFSKQSKTRIIRTEDQNETDYTKAIRELAKYCKLESIKLDSVITLCDISGRFDQMMSNINTLFKSRSILPDIKVYQMTSTCLTWLLHEGEHVIDIPLKLREDKEWCALIPIGSSSQVTTTGLKWNLNKTVLEFGHLVSSSNTYNGEPTVRIITDNPVLWSMSIEHLTYEE